MNHFSYFSEIEEAFIRRRGRHLLLSPLDWSLIEKWKEAGIPLRIVLRAVSSVFDRLEAEPGRRASVRSLSFCEDAVEAEYKQWLESRAGGATEGGNIEHTSDGKSEVAAQMVPEQIESRLNAVRAARCGVENEVAGALDAILAQLADLKLRSAPESELEEELSRMDELVNDALMRDLAKGSASAVKTELEQTLSRNSAAMDKCDYARTLDLLVRKRIREESGIPLLGLYRL